MPVEDYPRLPDMPSTAGTVDAAEFATAVAQAAIAAGRDDTLPMLTGVRLEIAGEKLTLAATDRYRLAVRELTWKPDNPSAEDVAVLVPARTLADAAKSLAGSDTLTISLSSGSGGGGGTGSPGPKAAASSDSAAPTAAGPAGPPPGCWTPPSRPTSRIVPNDWASSAEVDVAELVHVGAARGPGRRPRTPRCVWSSATAACRLSAGGEKRAGPRSRCEVSFDGEPITTAFNPQFLLDGLGALSTANARMLFTSANKPAVLRPETDSGSGAYTYVIDAGPDAVLMFCHRL